jgi:hypothetical protein
LGQIDGSCGNGLGVIAIRAVSCPALDVFIDHQRGWQSSANQQDKSNQQPPEEARIWSMDHINTSCKDNERISAVDCYLSRFLILL